MVRIFEEKELSVGKKIITEKVNYLVNVMRKKVNDELIIVNGSNKEFVGKISKISKKEVEILIERSEKEKNNNVFLGLIFPSIHKIDLLLKSAIELGITEIIPYKAQYQQVKFNFDKMKYNIIEAIEQSERLDFPIINKENSLQDIFKNLENCNNVNVFFCEERSEKEFNLKNFNFEKDYKNYILVGCEGGFSQEEKNFIKSFNFVKIINLNENILRTETASTSAISIIKYLMGS